MSLSLDDWLKPSDEAVEATNSVVDVVDDEDPMGVANTLSAADLQLPDLGLPDIKWWVDLEFLDLASGPPANFNSGQEKAKNKHNPTLGYHFPDIFFDTTAGQGSSSSAASLFGSAGDDPHRSLIGDQTFENFEKGLLADLFPSSATGHDDVKLLDDFDITSETTNNAGATAGTSTTNLSSVPEQQQGIKDEVEASVVKTEGAAKVVDHDVDPYAVPMDVLQTISKNFEKLQADFDKASTSSSSTTVPSVADENRVIRIKSIRTVPPEANIEEVIERPEGTVATIAIQTNKANNTTTFTILPRIGRLPGHTFLVKTNNLSQATKMIKPLHLDRLPVFKNLFHNIKVVPPTGANRTFNAVRNHEAVHGARKENIEVVESNKGPVAEKKLIKDAGTLETDLLHELSEFDVHYDKIDIAKRDDGKLDWICPEDQCSRSFPKRSQLKLHIFSHRGVKPYKCDYDGCKWAFQTTVKLKRHQESHKGIKPFMCNSPGCEDKNFSTVYNLNAHIKDHTKIKTDRFKCSLCDDNFKDQRYLDIHLRNYHDEMANYACPHPDCLKMFFTKLHLGRHIKSHDVIRDTNDLICTICEKTFTKSSLLKVHQRIHTGQRPYTCESPGCQWSFRTSSKLRRHERSHKNERRHPCSLCTKAYLRPEHLKDHFDVVHLDQRLICPYEKCESRFTQRPSLLAHVKKHQDDPQALEQQRYRCVLEKCNKKFQSRRCLTQHVNREHRPKLKQDKKTKGAQVLLGQDPSEVDLIALLSCVGDEDLKLTLDKPEELVTVDASAITPIKDETLKAGPNIISKSRKRRQNGSKSAAKKIKKESDTCTVQDVKPVESTINMQDLV